MEIYVFIIFIDKIINFLIGCLLTLKLEFFHQGFSIFLIFRNNNVNGKFYRKKLR